jgi:hypothetical protein
MDIVGEWVIHFDWGGSGKYIDDIIVFNDNGTFIVPSEGATGKWVQFDDMILWQYNDYDSLRTAYSGNIIKDSMLSGTMGEFSNGDAGRWYAFKRPGVKNAKESKPEFNIVGKKLN